MSPLLPSPKGEVPKEQDQLVGSNLDPKTQAEIEEDKEFLNARELFSKLQKAKYLSQKIKAPKDLKEISQKDDQRQQHIKLGEGEVTVKVGEDSELLRDRISKTKQKKLLYPRVREVVLQLYSLLQNKGLLVKRNIQTALVELDQFTKRGDIAEASLLRKYIAEEIGIYKEVL